MSATPAETAGKASPPASRPASPSPSRTGFRTLARMGTALRRNSTGFLLNRQTVSRSASKSSLKLEATQSPPAEGNASAPDTVPESPAREAAALEAESSERAAVGPSPLSHEAKATPDSTPAPPPPAVLTAEPVPIAAAPSSQASTSAQVVSEASALPPAPAQPITQTLTAPSVPQAAVQPIAQPSTVLVAQSVAQPVQPTAQPVTQPIVQAPVQPAVQPTTQPPIAQVAPPSDIPTVIRQAAPAADPVAHENLLAGLQPAVPIEERGADYFAWNNIPITTMKKASTSSLSVRQPTQESTPVPSVAIPEIAPVKAVESQPDPYAANSFAWKDEALVAPSKKSSMDIPRIPSQEQFTASPKPIAAALPKPPSRAASREQLVASPKHSSVNLSRPSSREQLVASPPQVPHELSPKASKSSLASSYGQVVNVTSGGRRFSVSIDPSAEPARGRSRSRSSIRVSFDDPYTDPFADPPASNGFAIPQQSTALSPIYSVDTPMVEEFSSMPKPNTENVSFPKPEYQPISEEPDNLNELNEATPPGMISMPLPDIHEVVKTSIVRQPSAYSIGESSGIVDHAPQETDERLPLLPRMPTPSVSKAPEAYAFTDVPVGSSSTNGVPWPAVQRSFVSHGWTQHVLPDSTVYYHHQEMRVTTDIDLRRDKKVEAVMFYLSSKARAGSVLPPDGWELWLRNAGKGRYDFTPIRGFVNHRDRMLSFEPPQAIDVSALSEDDKLDSEYRYWSYMESHPAHALLPHEAHGEAMDALRWCYAECLLPSKQSTPQLFAPQECQELMGLLRSSEEDPTRPSIVHTRIVSRVLLRKAQWRQQHFRPDKPLPGDASRIEPNRPRSIRRAIVDVILSILCLGIPYLFMGRSSSRRDEEGGMRSHGPLLVIGACACLVAAVILSASVTFLTLPGLDDISRLASMIAILFSASSMVSAVIAMFKYRSDIERTVVYVGGEGLMVHSRRSIVMSLPVVFLAWAIAAFVTGITFYSFRGVTLTNRLIIREPFNETTHWAVVGGLGGVAGILIISILLSGR